MSSGKPYRRWGKPAKSDHQPNSASCLGLFYAPQFQQTFNHGLEMNVNVSSNSLEQVYNNEFTQVASRPHFQQASSNRSQAYRGRAGIRSHGRGYGKKGYHNMMNQQFFGEQNPVSVLGAPDDVLPKKEGWTRKTLYAMVKAFVDDPNANEMSFPPTLTATERHIVHQIALNFTLHHCSKGSKSERVLTLRKIGSVSEQQKDREFAALNGVRVKTIDGYQGAQRFPHDYSNSILNSITNLLQPYVYKMYRQLKVTAEKKLRGRNFAILQPGLKIVPPGNVSAQRHQELQEFRKGLPSYKRKAEIVDAIKNNSIVVVSGDTGCGKTTQIPQILYDANIFPKDNEIICTQPRRISALSVAQRVAEERGEACGDGCGYIIRFDNMTSQRTKIVYVTTGILLRRLHTDPELNGVSCVVVDEVHERDVETDFCLLLLRDRLFEQQRNGQRYKNHIKVIVMSATVQIEKVISYFTNPFTAKAPPLITIPGTLFPVEEYFLEDALRWTKMPLSSVSAIVTSSFNAEKNDRSGNTETSGDQDMYKKIRDTVFQGANLDPESLVPYELVINLISYIHRDSRDLSESILVFLPGWASISRVGTMIQRLPIARELSVLQLHSSLTAKEQQRVFFRPPKGYRKVVLSTNIAETSITIDDIVYVIDSCLTKGVTYDPRGNTSALKAAYMSKANGLQRRGRAGRCRAGVCVHLLPKHAYDLLPDFFLPEIIRTPLEEVCLQTKALKPNETCTQVLSRALDSPPTDSTEYAVKLLKDIGAFTCEKEQLTTLGRALSKFPIHPFLGKMLLVAACLGVLEPVATIAAYLSGKSPFIKPLPHQKIDIRQVIANFDDGLLSDHLSVMRLFDEWKKSNCSADFAIQNFADNTILRSMDRIRKQLLRLVQDSSLLRRFKDPMRVASRHSNNIGLIRMAALWSLYPCIASVEYRAKRNSRRAEIFCWDNKVAQFTMGSALAMKNRNDFNDRAFIFYHERMQLESNLTLFDATAITPVELALCLRELTVRPLNEVFPAFLVDEESKMAPAFPFILGKDEDTKNLAVLFFDGDKKVYVTSMPVALALRDLRECMDYYLALAIKEVKASLFPEDLIRALAYTIGYPITHEAHFDVPKACGGDKFASLDDKKVLLSERVDVSHIDAKLDCDSSEEDDAPDTVMENFDSFQLTEEEVSRITSVFGDLAILNRYTSAGLLKAFEKGEHYRVVEAGLNDAPRSDALVSEDVDDEFNEDEEDDDIIFADSDYGGLVVMYDDK